MSRRPHDHSVNRNFSALSGGCARKQGDATEPSANSQCTFSNGIDLTTWPDNSPTIPRGLLHNSPFGSHFLELTTEPHVSVRREI